MWPDGLEVMKHQNVKIDKVPGIYVFKKGTYYHYDSYYQKGLIIHFISRIVNPAYQIHEVDEADRFQVLHREFEESSDFYYGKYVEIGEWYRQMPFRTRVLALFGDRKEYNLEFKLFKEAA